MSQQIRLADSNVNTYANTPNERSTILEAEVPDNERWFIADGALPVVKLLDSGGADISANSDIYLAVKVPGSDFAKKIDKNGYGVFARNDIQSQYDTEKNAKARFDIDNGGVVFKEQYKILVQIDSPDTVDISQCTVEINDVKKGTM